MSGGGTLQCGDDRELPGLSFNLSFVNVGGGVGKMTTIF